MQFRRLARRPGTQRRGVVCVVTVLVLVVVVAVVLRAGGFNRALDGPNGRGQVPGEAAGVRQEFVRESGPAWYATPVSKAVEEELAKLRWTTPPPRVNAEQDNPSKLLAQIGEHLRQIRSINDGAKMSRPPLLRPRYATLNAVKDIDFSERTKDLPPLISTLAEHDVWAHTQVARIDELWRLQEMNFRHVTITRETCADFSFRAGITHSTLHRLILDRDNVSAVVGASVDDFCRLLTGYFVGGVYRDADVVWAGSLQHVLTSRVGHGGISAGPRPLAFFAVKRFQQCFKAAVSILTTQLMKESTNEELTSLSAIVEMAIKALSEDLCPSLNRLYPMEPDFGVVLQWAAWAGIPKTLRFGLYNQPLTSSTRREWRKYKKAPASAILAPMTGRTIGLVHYYQTAEATGSFPAPFPATHAFDGDLTTYSSTADDGLNDRLIITFGDGVALPWSRKSERPKIQCVALYAPREDRFVNALVGVRVELMSKDQHSVLRPLFKSPTIRHAATSYKIRILHDEVDDKATPGTIVNQVVVSRSAGALRLSEVQLFVDDPNCTAASPLEVQGSRLEYVSSSASDPVTDTIGLVELLKRRTFDCPSTRAVSWSGVVEYVACQDPAPLVPDQCGILTVVHNQFPHLVDEGLSVTAAANGCQLAAMFTDPVPDHVKELNYTILPHTLHTRHEIRSTDIALKNVITTRFKKQHVNILHVDYNGREWWLAQELVQAAQEGLVDHVFLHLYLAENIASDPLQIASHVSFLHQLLLHYELIGSSVTPKSPTMTVFRNLRHVPTQWQISLLRKSAAHARKAKLDEAKKDITPASMTFAPAADETESDAVFEAGKLPYNATDEFPRVMHTIWKTAKLPVAAVALDETWKKQETGLSFEHHDDDECMALAKKFPVLGSRYASLQLKVMRADICRLLIIYYHGGLYRDLDVRWVRPLADWIDWSREVIYGNEDEHYCQWFFGAKRHNPCIFRTLVHITRLLRNFKLDFRKADKDLVIEVTGPGAFTVGMQGCPAAPMLTPLNLTQTVVWHEFAAMNWGQGYSSWLVQRDRLAGWRRMGETESKRVEFFEKPSNTILQPFAAATALLVSSVSQTSERYGTVLDITPAHYAIDRNLDTFIVGTDAPQQSWTLTFHDGFKIARQQMTSNSETAKYDSLDDVPLESRLACVRIYHKRRFSDQEHSNAVTVQLLDSQSKVVYSTAELWRMTDTFMTLPVTTNLSSAEVKSVRVHKNFGTVLIAEIEVSPSPDCSTAHRLAGYPTAESLIASQATGRKWAWTTAWIGLQLMRTTIDCADKILAMESEYRFFWCPKWTPKSLTVLHLVSHAPTASYNTVSDDRVPNVQHYRRAKDCTGETNCVVKASDLLSVPTSSVHRMITIDVDEYEAENSVSWKVLGRLLAHVTKKGDEDAPEFVLIRWRFPVSDPAIFSKNADHSPTSPGPLTSGLVSARLGLLLRYYEIYATQPVDYTVASRCNTAPLMMGSLLLECIDLSLVKKSFVHRTRF